MFLRCCICGVSIGVTEAAGFLASSRPHVLCSSSCRQSCAGQLGSLLNLYLEFSRFPLLCMGKEIDRAFGTSWLSARWMADPAGGHGQTARASGQPSIVVGYDADCRHGVLPHEASLDHMRVE